MVFLLSFLNRRPNGFEMKRQSTKLSSSFQVEPLIGFSRFDAQRQTLMKRAKQERLSAVRRSHKDLKIEKALQ